MGLCAPVVYRTEVSQAEKDGEDPWEEGDKEEEACIQQDRRDDQRRESDTTTARQWLRSVGS